MTIIIVVAETEAVTMSVAVAMSVRECREDVKLVKPGPWLLVAQYGHGHGRLP